MTPAAVREWLQKQTHFAAPDFVRKDCWKCVLARYLQASGFPYANFDGVSAYKGGGTDGQTIVPAKVAACVSLFDSGQEPADAFA